MYKEQSEILSNKDKTKGAVVRLNGVVHPAEFSDFSEYGADLKMNSFSNVGDILEVECELLPKHIIKPKGKVIISKALMTSKKIIYDVKLKWVNLDFDDKKTIFDYNGMNAESRKEQRLPCAFETDVSHPIQMENLNIMNASIGGLFLATDTPIPKNTFIRMEAMLDGKSIIIDGHVVHQVDRELGQRISRPIGVGVAILGMSNPDSDIWYSSLAKIKECVV